MVFDYFFPSIFAFGVVDVPPEAFYNWSNYITATDNVLANDPHATNQLFRVAGVARSPANPAADRAAVISLLAYSIGGTPDLIATAGGNPYGNLLRWYWGSDNDLLLNRNVERVRSDPSAVRYLAQHYQPNARLQRPLVALHTTQDPIVPFAHELLYSVRAFMEGTSPLFTVLSVPRYGHCNFTSQELLGAFSLLVRRAGVPTTAALDAYLPPR